MSLLILLLVASIVANVVTSLRRRSSSSEKEIAELRERTLRLEQTVENMSADIERFADGQRFLTALLEDRAKAQPAIKAPPPSPPTT